MQVDHPKKLGFLFEPMRYKVARGGRGSAKSWSFARALLVLGRSQKLRIGCFREVQKSIRDSVHKLLSDQIETLGLGAFYEITQTEIRGSNGTEFLFSGLSTQTVESIKSFEGINIAWVEEAQTVSKRSWSILIPTIRKSGSEIWVSYNPELESDETHRRFAVNPPTDCISIEMNYHDNPWFPEVLEKERQHAEKTLPKAEYENIWLGKCLPAVSGAIYFDEVSAAEEGKRICNVPYDPMLKVHVVFDLGWNDAMAISLVQKSSSEIRIIEYIEDTHKTLDYYSSLLRERRFNWGRCYMPHDARAKNIQTGKSAEEVMRALGWDVTITPNHSIEDGIRVVRMTFPRISFDKVKTERLIQCAKRYRRAINQTTKEAGAPMHDEWSHGADCLRYACINADDMKNETWGGAINYPQIGIV